MGLLFPALVVCAPALRRRRLGTGKVKRSLAIGVMTVLALYLVACGGSSAKTPTGGTPTGSYSIAITSSAGDVQTTTTITLNVQ